MKRLASSALRFERSEVCARSVTAAIFALLFVASPHQAFADTYANWGELAVNETEGVDYRIRTRQEDSGVLIQAIHGGKIEQGTSELAIATAGYDHSYYLFEGIKVTGNGTLHITGVNFDEPIAVKMTAMAIRVVSLHGAADVDVNGDGIVDPVAIAFVGGADLEMRDLIFDELRAAGFDVREAPAHLGGDLPDNITNEGLRHAGVQIEMTTTLRNSFFSSSGGTTQRLADFASAIRAGIYQTGLDAGGTVFNADPAPYASYLNGGQIFVLTSSSYLAYHVGSNGGYGEYLGIIAFEIYGMNGNLVSVVEVVRNKYGYHKQLFRPLNLPRSGYYRIKVINGMALPTWLSGVIRE